MQEERVILKPLVAAGALAAVVTGCLMAALTMSAGGLASSLPAIVALTGTLVVAGVLFGWMLDTERLRAGFGPGILYWIVTFPLVRFVQELMVEGGGSGLAEGVAGFFVFQAMVGGAFGLGFYLLHNQISTWLAASAERRSSSHGPDRELIRK
jgi:hypothetical protein